MTWGGADIDIYLCICLVDRHVPKEEPRDIQLLYIFNHSAEKSVHITVHIILFGTSMQPNLDFVEQHYLREWMCLTIKRCMILQWDYPTDRNPRCGSCLIQCNQEPHHCCIFAAPQLSMEAGLQPTEDFMYWYPIRTSTNDGMKYGSCLRTSSQHMMSWQYARSSCP